VINVITAATAAKRKTNRMTTSKKKTKNATAPPPTKARVAKRRAQAAPLKAEPAPKAAGAKKPATAARGGSKTAKILDLLKRPGGVSLKELVKATGWQPQRSCPAVTWGRAASYGQVLRIRGRVHWRSAATPRNRASTGSDQRIDRDTKEQALKTRLGQLMRS
jgi:hypothetical protein